MLELLYVILYVLGIYSFVILLLYSMSLESPPENVDKDVNTVVSSKGHTNDTDKSNSHTVSRTHKEHSQTD
jgi:cytoskeletal protein RodZ